jgi:hypothetical protein
MFSIGNSENGSIIDSGDESAYIFALSGTKGRGKFGSRGVRENIGDIGTIGESVTFKTETISFVGTDDFEGTIFFNGEKFC